MCRTIVTAPCGREFIRASFRLKGVVAVPRRGVSTVAGVRESGPTHLQLRCPRKHLLEADTDTLNDSEQDGTANGTVPRRLVPASDGQRAAREETGNLGRVRSWMIGLSIGQLAIALYLSHMALAKCFAECAGNSEHIRILLFPDSLNGAVECAEHATPDAEVAAQYWRAHLDGCDGT